LKNPIKQLFGQTAVYGLGIVLPRLLNYVLLTPFYTRVFDRATYGIITELYAYVVFLLVILTYGMETGYFRFASKTKRNGGIYSSVLSSLFVTSGFFIAAVMVFGGSIASWMDYGDHPEYIRWLAVIVGVDAFTAIPFARIRLNNKPLKYALIRIIEVLVNIGLNLFFLWYAPKHSESGLVSLIYNENIGVGYVLISNMVSSLVKLLLLSGEIIAAFKFSFSATILKKVLKYSYPLLVAGLAGTVNEALDRILLKHMIPPEQLPMEQLGIYGANFKMAVLMTLFVQMFKYAAEPFFFSRSADKNARELYADVMNFFVAAGLIIFLLVNIYMDYFILFIGKGYREGAHIVPVVLMANLVMGIFFNLSIWYKLTNKTMYGAVLVIIGASVTIVVNVLFIPRYGYVASAWAHLLCYSLMVLLSYLWSRKHYPVPYKIGRIMAYMAVALMIYFLNELFLQDIGRIKDLIGLLLLFAFCLFIWLMERPVFMKYKNET
jgi:O-antigen/teichoic acid export membrane protein